MKPRISMITLGVEDVAKSVEFYRRLQFPQLESQPHVAFFQLNGTWLCLYGKDALAAEAGVSRAKSGFAGISLSHNVASAQEVREVFGAAIAAGAVELTKPQRAHWGGYHGYFQDPDGYLWEIMHNPFMWVGPSDDVGDEAGDDTTGGE